MVPVSRESQTSGGMDMLIQMNKGTHDILSVEIEDLADTVRPAELS